MTLGRLIILMFSLGAWALYGKKFTSQFCEFDLPSTWECALEGTEWLCQSTNEDRKKEAIIILAAKERGEQDSLDKYQKYLKEKKVFELPGGKKIISNPSYAKSTQINEHSWIDALHFQSEIPGFYTRYLATVKEGLGMAVTFSVGKDHYSTYLPVFERMIKTLKVFAPSKYSQRGELRPSKRGGENEGVTFVPDDQGIPQIAMGKQTRRVASGTSSTGTYLILTLIGVAGVFVVLKTRKKK